MHPFRYLKATDIASAIHSVASESRAMYLAGGTSLVDLMKLNVLAPTLLVDINALPLNHIEERAGGIRIGALMRNSDVAYHPLVQERYPLLAQAILAGATAQLRNMATVGGNLLQRTRCAYFRDSVMACNKRQPGTGCSALHGHNRSHAILGGSRSCIATYPSDMGVALAALDAVLQIEGPHGSRNVALTEFYTQPANRPARETVLEHGELITSIDLPPSPFADHSYYLKIRERSTYAFAAVSVAVALDLPDGIVRDARLALGGIATIPWRVPQAETILAGHAPQAEIYEAAAQAAVQEVWLQRDNAFKAELTRRAIVKALEKVGGKV